MTCTVLYVLQTRKRKSSHLSNYIALFVKENETSKQNAHTTTTTKNAAKVLFAEKWEG